jgi:hypothetical protein
MNSSPDYNDILKNVDKELGTYSGFVPVPVRKSQIFGKNMYYIASFIAIVCVIYMWKPSFVEKAEGGVSFVKVMLYSVLFESIIVGGRYLYLYKSR